MCECKDGRTANDWLTFLLAHEGQELQVWFRAGYIGLPLAAGTFRGVSPEGFGKIHQDAVTGPNGQIAAPAGELHFDLSQVGAVTISSKLDAKPLSSVALY